MKEKKIGIQKYVYLYKFYTGKCLIHLVQVPYTCAKIYKKKKLYLTFMHM